MNYKSWLPILFILALTVFSHAMGRSVKDVNNVVVHNPDPNFKINSGSDLIYFAGQRNRSNFKMLNDPILRKYFAPNFIWDVRHFKNQEELDQMLNLLRHHNPEAIIGFYASACLSMPKNKDTFPPAKIPLEQCKSHWFLRKKNNVDYVKWPNRNDRYFLDMRKTDVRQAVIGLAIARAKYYKFDTLCFDNCYWGYGMGGVSKQEWTLAFEKFYSEAGRAAHDNNMLCIVNIATPVEKINEAFLAISPYVDGLMTEMAFHRNIRLKKYVEKELEGYEKVLKQKKMVFLFPSHKEDLSFTLTKIRPLAKRYGKIYVCNRGPVKPNHLYFID